MKQITIKKLVLTDGTYYYENTSATQSYFTNDITKAWNFYCENYPKLNEKRRLHWELDNWTKNKPIVLNEPNEYGYAKPNNDIKIDRSKFVLKWIIIKKTIKEKKFKYEDFANTDYQMCGEKYDELI